MHHYQNTHGVRLFLLAGWSAAFIVLIIHIVAPSEWRWLTPDEQKVVAAAVGVSGGGILNLGDLGRAGPGHPDDPRRVD